MDNSSVVVFGYGELGVAALETLSTAGARVLAAGVPSNRSGPDIERVSAFAASRQLPLLVQPSSRDIAPFVARLQALAPDVLVVWSYSMKVPQVVLDIPRQGAVNVHGGLLPEYRGGHVMQWAIINGEPETAVTLHYMDDGLDTGPVIAESRFAILDDEDATHVRTRLKTSGAELLARWWPQIADGTAPRKAQDQSRARYWPMRMPEDGRIDWNASNVQVCRLVRALACNEPGAFAEIAGARMSVKKARPLPSLTSALPGSMVSRDAAGVRIAAGAGDVLVTEMTAVHG